MGGELIHQIYRLKVATWAHQASRWDDLGRLAPGSKLTIFQVHARTQRAALAESSCINLHMRRAKICTEDVLNSAHKRCENLNIRDAKSAHKTC